MSLTRKSPLRRGKPLARVSKKRKKENREYMAKREVFLTANSVCQCCQREPATQVHHAAKRGRFLLREDTFRALCFRCHEAVERDANWAKSVGLTLTPEQRRLLP